MTMTGEDDDSLHESGSYSLQGTYLCAFHRCVCGIRSYGVSLLILDRIWHMMMRHGNTRKARRCKTQQQQPQLTIDVAEEVIEAHRTPSPSPLPLPLPRRAR
ncbi:hypothetical protein O6H91_06G101900 [Diphasiastrum complanatum]|uniref:Uncharacterized protein n=1 Tax=Diphasiastrum complanatum TaxID=34168 RepID=A0ACC2DGW7_DIPCM|nr:hypothetical protein O6H91_06G101900 [Diphasiastrum complanatum]